MCLLSYRLEIWRSNCHGLILCLLKIDLSNWILWDGQQENPKGIRTGVLKMGAEMDLVGGTLNSVLLLEEISV